MQRESQKDREKQEEREEKLRIVKDNIDKDVNATFNIIENSYLNKIKTLVKYFIHKYKKDLILILSIIIIVFTATLINFRVIAENKAKVRKEQIGNTSTIINISMNKSNYQLNLDLSTVAINTKTNKSIQLDKSIWLNSDMELAQDTYKIDDKSLKIDKKLQISDIEVSDELVYIKSNNNNNTAIKELILTNDKLDLNNTDSTLEKLIEKKSLYDSYIVLRETITGGKLQKNSLNNTINEYEKTAKYSNNKCNIVLRFEELGDLDLNKLQDTTDSPEVNYLREEGVLRISFNNEDILYISGINNEKIKCYAEDLLTTNNSNVFVHKNFNNKKSNGYKTFALKYNKSLYVIRANENAKEDILINLFKQLNIDYNSIQIEEIQEVIPK